MLFFIHLGSRRVWLAGGTPQPHAAWVAQQARNFSMVVEDWKLPCQRRDRAAYFLPSIRSSESEVCQTKASG